MHKYVWDLVDLGCIVFLTSWRRLLSFVICICHFFFFVLFDVSVCPLQLTHFPCLLSAPWISPSTSPLDAFFFFCGVLFA